MEEFVLPKGGSVWQTRWSSIQTKTIWPPAIVHEKA